MDGIREFDDLRAHGLDDVRWALPDGVLEEPAETPPPTVGELVSKIDCCCTEQSINVPPIPDLSDHSARDSMATRSEHPADPSPLQVPFGAASQWKRSFKRSLDFALALTLLVVCSPLFAVVALLVKLTSRGPVFFVQERVGLNKRKFPLLKFRTMVADAEKRIAELEHLNEASGPVFKIKNDPRITKLGRFLRRTSIDEIPQLINVLHGAMSLVGPRPLPVRDVNGFNKEWQRRRFSVIPGMTCLWQINGRNHVDFEKWMQLDLYYIDHWSLWLDLKILLKTVPAVIKGSGAS
jgi:exopolysaccharide biosynthesis polyprenyl glycosylphosphotransferase